MHDDGALWAWDATRLARAIGAREVTAVEVATSHLERIDELNTTLNALVETFPDETLASAAAVDGALASGLSPGPLAGVPVAVKINTDQTGHATTHGVSLLAGAVAAEDAPVVANLRREGAVVIGRSNSPAFGYRAFTSNALHGRTLSPWSPDHTPGGSSGGSSVAVATGMAAIGQGNDLAGSIRYPAYASGLVGLRPTVGWVPRGSTLSGVGDSLMTQLMTVDGPLARSADDLLLAYMTMSAYGDPRDLFWFPPAIMLEPPARKVGVVRDVDVAPPHPSVTRSIDVTVDALIDAGYEVREIEAPQLGEAYRLWWYLCISEYRGADRLLLDAGDELAATVVQNYETVADEWWPEPADLTRYLAAQGRRQVLIREVQQLMQEWPLLLTPVSAEPPFIHDFDALDLDSTERFMQSNWPMMALPALALPAVAVPTGLSDGLPSGVQVIGRRNDDLSLIGLAAAIEARLGRLTPTDMRW